MCVILVVRPSFAGFGISGAQKFGYLVDCKYEECDITPDLYISVYTEVSIQKIYKCVVGFISEV